MFRRKTLVAMAIRVSKRLTSIGWQRADSADNAYLTTSSCSPSRCSIITGAILTTPEPRSYVVLPDAPIPFQNFEGSHYYTVLSGKNHMFSNEDRAFDKITDGGGRAERDWVGHVQNRPKDNRSSFG